MRLDHRPCHPHLGRLTVRNVSHLDRSAWAYDASCRVRRPRRRYAPFVVSSAAVAAGLLFEAFIALSASCSSSSAALSRTLAICLVSASRSSQPFGLRVPTPRRFRPSCSARRPLAAPSCRPGSCHRSLVLFRCRASPCELHSAFSRPMSDRALRGKREDGFSVTSGPDEDGNEARATGSGTDAQRVSRRLTGNRNCVRTV